MLEKKTQHTCFIPDFLKASSLIHACIYAEDWDDTFDTGEKLNYKLMQSRFKYALHRPKKHKTKKKCVDAFLLSLNFVHNSRKLCFHKNGMDSLTLALFIHEY